MGINKKKKKPAKSNHQLAFIKCIQQLGKFIKDIKNTNQQLSNQQLQYQFNEILQKGLNRKLGVLQQNYVKYFKNMLNKICEQNIKNNEDNEIARINDKMIQFKPGNDQKKKQFLCCRTSFYNQQIIKQAENQVSQYKCFNSIYFNQIQIKSLKKTICAFLNTQGGIIYLGIYQHVDTKRRKIIGMQMNEYQKQQLQFILRRDIMSSITPDIVANKLYSIVFVPIRDNYQPYDIIPGKFLIKIYVNYGIRNEIYSYRHNDKDNFSFRTENQVIHKQGREVLNASRERLKNPAPIPIPRYHNGSCIQPQDGIPSFNDKNKQYDKLSDKKQFYNNNGGDKNQKPKYRERIISDFIISQLKIQELEKYIMEKKLQNLLMVKNIQYSQSCLLKLKDVQKRYNVVEFLSQIQKDRSFTFIEVQKMIQIQDSENYNIAEEIFSGCKLDFTKIDDKGIFQFSDNFYSIKAYQKLKECDIKANFVGD